MNARTKEEIMEDYADECFYRATHNQPEVGPAEFFEKTLSAEEQALFGTATDFDAAVGDARDRGDW